MRLDDRVDHPDDQAFGDAPRRKTALELNNPPYESGPFSFAETAGFEATFSARYSTRARSK